LAAYNPSLAEWHDAAVTSLCDRISRRIRSVGDQLNRPRTPLDFNASGAAALNNWTRNLAQGSGLRLDKMQEDGRQLLHLSAANQGGSGSWRTRVYLAGGRYRFEGRARASDSAKGSGVCLRISGDRPALLPITGTDWTPLNYTFDIGGGGTEVVLVCEFSGSRGEVWFDTDSLRLVRE
jgi:hypothetical protein